MRAPHLTRFLSRDRKRKTEERETSAGAKRRAKDSALETHPASSLMTEESLQSKDIPNNRNDNLRDALSHADNEEKRPRLSVHPERVSAALNDGDSLALQPDLSPLTQQRIAAMTSTQDAKAAEHRAFLESMLQQHARFVMDTSRTFQSNPVVLQTAIKAHQHCLDSLLDLYYKMHTRDSSAERTSALFQENYKMLQQLHETAASRSTTPADPGTSISHTSSIPLSAHAGMKKSDSRPFSAEGDGQSRKDAASLPKKTPQQAASPFEQPFGSLLLCHPVSTKQDPLLGPKKSPSEGTGIFSGQSISGQRKRRDPSSNDREQGDGRNPKDATPLSPTRAEHGYSDNEHVERQGAAYTKAGVATSATIIAEVMLPAPSPSQSTKSRKKIGSVAAGRRQDSDEARETFREDQGAAVAERAPTSIAANTSKDAGANSANEATTNKENDPSLSIQATPSMKIADTLQPQTNSWTCSECTLENSPSKRRCEVCQARRPVTPKTSLLDLPKRTPRGRRKKQEDWQDASQCLFGDSQPKANMPGKKTSDAAKTALTGPAAASAGPAAEPSSAAPNNSSVCELSGKTKETSIDGSRRITLDQEPAAKSQDRTEELEVDMSPSFESQETEDPTLLIEETVTADNDKKDESSPDVSLAKSTAVPKNGKPKGGAVFNPYSAPWQSNAASRRFDRELEMATAQANLARKGPIKTAGAASEWFTAAKRRPSTRKSDDSDLWSDTEADDGPYHEVVRGKARKALPTHDCPDCARFYNGLIVDSQSIDIRQFCRHRSRHGPPPETPEDFWELDFIDELRAKRKAEEEERQAAAEASSAARSK